MMALGVWKHFSDGCLVCRSDEKAFAELALTLSGFFRQDMIEESLRALELAFRCTTEPLGGASIGFEFWHCLLPLI